MNVDLLDRKIIYELGKDARISYKELAKKIGSKKEVVAYRISNLIKNKIIIKFVPVFSLTRLGIFSGKIYINLKGMKNKEAIERLIDNKDVAWVAESVGKWDLLLGFYYKNIIDFGEKKEKILFQLSKYIQDYDISFIEEGFVFNREYLIEKGREVRKEFIFGGISTNEKLEEVDYKIINLIKNNGRFEYLDIAKKLSIDARTVLSRIRYLKEKGILQGFTTFIDLDKIGYGFYKILIFLSSPEFAHKNKVLTLLRSNPNVIHIIKSVSSWDLEAEMEYENIGKVYDFINKLKNEFPDVIKKVELVSVKNERKLDFFPEKMV
ncbi:MAG: Lrp/AsnC family transcriptional regulator [Nanoarchaeota archaeon]